MKKLLIGIVLITSLLVLAPPAQATPRYGYRYTAAHGYIVWNRNDYQGPVRARCSWYAQGTRWTTNWFLSSGEYKWTTSDAGNWGNRRPRNLRCNYVRL
jgi:hypothetical protein